MKLRGVIIGGLFLALFVGAVFSFHAALVKERAEETPWIAGMQDYSVEVKYPTTQALPHLGVKVTLTAAQLPKGPPLPVASSTKPAADGRYHIHWDSTKFPNGTYLVDLQAHWGNQLIGEESRRITIANSY